MRLPLALVLCWLVTVTRADAQSPSSVPASATVTLPPALDRVLRDYEQAWRTRDVEALVLLFTDDGFVLQPGRAPARGHAALRSVYRGQGGGRLRLRALAYAASDSVGYIIGAYGYGENPTDMGKFTLTLRRRPGSVWRIASDMDNGNVAASPAGVADTITGGSGRP
jgi:ketosteroid isomerase-like protein